MGLIKVLIDGLFTKAGKHYEWLKFQHPERVDDIIFIEKLLTALAQFKSETK